MVNVYPYYDYIADPVNNRLDFVQFATDETVLIDGELNYTNLYDATLDVLYWAMERVLARDVHLAVSETGWPTAGNGNITTPVLAAIYNINFANHVLRNSGTPKRPEPVNVDAFIFGMFDENLDPNVQRRHFGIFNTSTLEPVYPLFTTSGNKHFNVAQKVGRKRIGGCND
ncbi:hypothetical protein ACH5RR_003991 [Cinchona calisaya]|uniref:Glucan endo-1,3-beta-D-glucosidase n=1 Tax=Cinchona calisaya TaxID=153742 RepID=A0ABD3AWG2_9GENT